MIKHEKIKEYIWINEKQQTLIIAISMVYINKNETEINQNNKKSKSILE